MLKKLTALLLSVLIIISAIPLVSAAETVAPAFEWSKTQGLFAHGSTQATDTQSWQMWQHEIKETGNDPENYSLTDGNTSVKYFFMPKGSAEGKAEIYNSYNTNVTVNATVIPAKSIATVNYIANQRYTVSAGGKNYTLIFKKSTAEASIYVNNTNADGNGTELYSYLCKNKSNSASATASLVNGDGSTDNTSVKKIKGRGNTTWKKNKKPFNITYSDKVSIAGMEKGKKFSLLANYQDGSLVRNRLLYDLSDQVGMPYASDSRFVDLYMNGIYYGSYQLAQKIEVGSSDLINDIDDEAYLNADGTVSTDFPFLMEIDPSASSDDYTVTTDNKTSITIKAPEIQRGATGYDEVKAYVKAKFTELYRAISTTSTMAELEAVMDVDSFAKLYLINELGKNWDSGVSSVYLTYKQDSTGKWKFYASPVWDYDNSMGNCLGVSGDFNRMGISQEDYLSPENWWCQYKKYSASSSSFNLICRLAKCSVMKQRSAYIWFKEFVPAIEILTSENVADGELYSADVYYNLLEGTADCNYTRGWFLDTNSNWIADHSSLTKGTFDSTTKKYVKDTSATTYPATFKGEYDYTIDWFTTRASWLTGEFLTIGDLNSDGVVNDKDFSGDISPTTGSTEASTSATSPSEPQHTEPTEPTQPTDPVEITVKKTTAKKAQSKSAVSIKVTWEKVDNATGYVIYQKQGNGSYKKAKTVTASKTSHTFKKLKSATKYSYKIKTYRTVDSKNYYSGFSNVVTTSTKPIKVTFKKAKALSPNAVQLNWKKVARAGGYTVYQKAGKKFVKLGDISKKKNSAIVKNLKPSKKYSYKIRAFVKVNGKKIYGAYSKVLSAKTSKATYNSKGNYKLYPNVPDFGKAYGASLAVNVKSVKRNGRTVGVYLYFLDNVTSSDIDKYCEKLVKNGYKYYGSDKLSDGNTVMYFNDSQLLVSVSVTGGYFCVSCTKL